MTVELVEKGVKPDGTWYYTWIVDCPFPDMSDDERAKHNGERCRAWEEMGGWGAEFGELLIDGRKVG